jgi:pimeloyl-ACP methyl ester carboxylesterase
MFKRIKLLIVLGTSSLGIGLLASPPLYAAEPMPTVRAEEMAVQYHTVKIDGVNVFYREAGPKDAPAVLLLHGFPASSFMFRNLIPILATRYHVIAPDYPGYGQSDAPDHTTFHYTFDHLASIVDQLTQMLNLETFSVYVQDYGAPVGYRIAVAHPEKITGIIAQNGNAYVEGLPDGFWGPIKAYWADHSPENRARLEGVLTPDGYKSQYLTGVKDPSAISPDTWSLDAANLARPGNMDIQLDLLLDYGSNPPLYPKWQEYFRTSQPPMLIVWGKNDLIFPPTGAEPYKRDIKDLDFHLLDTGHFALEDSSVEIGDLMLKFLDKHVGKQQTTGMAPSNGGQPLARLEH